MAACGQMNFIDGSAKPLTKNKAMAIDIGEIQLTDDHKRRIAEIAEQTGRSWQEVVDDQLATDEEPANLKPYWSYKDRYIDDYEKWYAYFREWLSKQTSRNPNFDDSRESIYP
jgi:hypothetical protein